MHPVYFVFDVLAGEFLSGSIQITLKCGNETSCVFAPIYSMTLQSVFLPNYNSTSPTASHVFKESVKWKFLSSLIPIIGSP